MKIGKPEKYILAVLSLVLLYSSSAIGYDDKVTHPDLTKMAISVSNLDAYLKQNFVPQFNSGVSTILNGTPVRELLAQGSTSEDRPQCQASNHFHNPLLPWNASQMSDDSTPLAYLIREYCNTMGWPYIYRKSNVTWATGYKSPSPDGFKYMFLSSETPPPINWDSARESYYSALTGQSAASRDAGFAATFGALGHVLHLIQDMAVPAHVRNDFQSHLILNFEEDYYYNRYEYYVMKHNNIINEVLPVAPPDSNRRLTDFWDTNTYDGTNPSYSNAQGLAEFTNANFFSDFTIPLSQDFPVTPEHTFPQPGLDYYGNQYHICKDTNESGQIVKYLSRSTCPTSGPIDHFLTASLLNTPNGPAKLFWTDEKVHDTYARELLPRAVGYSAALLNYFFRGKLDMWLVTDSTYIIKNNSDEALSGTFSLYYNDTSDNRISIPSASWNMTINANANSVPVSFTRPIDPAYRYMLVFKGQMGQEQGAVIGKMVDLLLPAPTPISPLEGGYAYGLHDNGLVWRGVIGGNGNYEISIDGGNPIVVVADTKYTNILELSQGTHTWKVRTQNAAGTTGPWSTTITFTKYNYLNSPTILEPTVGLSVHNPVLKWNSILGASSYLVKIWENQIIPTYNTVNLSYDTASLGLNNQIWYWLVKAVDARGVEGFWSLSYPYSWTQISDEARGDISFALTWTWGGSSQAEGPDIDMQVTDPHGHILSTSRNGYGLGPCPDGGQIDFDDLGGWGNGDGGGPERVYWPTGQGPSGTYSYGVRYYQGDGTANYTVHVYKGTTLVATKTGTLASPGSYINIGSITK